MSMNRFQLDITGRTTAYLKLPTCPEKLRGAHTVTLASLLPAYKGPYVVFDFDDQRTLVGIEVIADDEDDEDEEVEEQPPDVAGVARVMESLSQHPETYVVGCGSLMGICHYLDGYRHAISALGYRDPLDAWTPWVDLRFGIHHTAWHWTRILLHAYGTDEAAIRALPELYCEYIKARAELGTEGIERRLRETLLERYGEEWFEPAETHTRPWSE
jgi:hypothetical protein